MQMQERRPIVVYWDLASKIDSIPFSLLTASLHSFASNLGQLVSFRAYSGGFVEEPAETQRQVRASLLSFGVGLTTYARDEPINVERLMLVDLFSFILDSPTTPYVVILAVNNPSAYVYTRGALEVRGKGVILVGGSQTDVAAVDWWEILAGVPRGFGFGGSSSASTTPRALPWHGSFDTDTPTAAPSIPSIHLQGATPLKQARGDVFDSPTRFSSLHLSPLAPIEDSEKQDEEDNGEEDDDVRQFVLEYWLSSRALETPPSQTGLPFRFSTDLPGTRPARSNSLPSIHEAWAKDGEGEKNWNDDQDDVDPVQDDIFVVTSEQDSEAAWPHPSPIPVSLPAPHHPKPPSPISPTVEQQKGKKGGGAAAKMHPVAKGVKQSSPIEGRRQASPAVKRLSQTLTGGPGYAPSGERRVVSGDSENSSLDAWPTPSAIFSHTLTPSPPVSRSRPLPTSYAASVRPPRSISSGPTAAPHSSGTFSLTGAFRPAPPSPSISDVLKGPLRTFLLLVEAIIANGGGEGKPVERGNVGTTLVRVKGTEPFYTEIGEEGFASYSRKAEKLGVVTMGMWAESSGWIKLAHKYVGAGKKRV